MIKAKGRNDGNNKLLSSVIASMLSPKYKLCFEASTHKVNFLRLKKLLFIKLAENFKI
jgi:hypothetical protein